MGLTAALQGCAGAAGLFRLGWFDPFFSNGGRSGRLPLAVWVQACENLGKCEANVAGFKGIFAEPRFVAISIHPGTTLVRINDPTVGYAPLVIQFALGKCRAEFVSGGKNLDREHEGCVEM